MLRTSLQQLSEDFRLTYCRLWMAILRQDLDGVKRYTQLLNGGELYPLLASIITARSWDSISKGVSWHPFTKTEVFLAYTQGHLFPTVHFNELSMQYAVFVTCLLYNKAFQWEVLGISF